MNREAIEACLRENRFADLHAALVELADSDRSERSLAFVNRCIDRLAEQGPNLVDTSVYVLRSMTLDPLAPRLRALALRDQLNLQIRFGGYDQFEQEIAGHGALPEAAPDFVIVAARLEELAPRLVRRYIGTAADEREVIAAELLARIEDWLTGLRARWPKAALLVHGFELPAGAFGLAECRVSDGQRRFVRDLNDRLAGACRARAGVYFVDVDRALAELGRRHARDPRMWAYARLPYSAAGLDAIASLLWRFISAIRTPRQKCLVLDCDNTLWGGILGEDGPDAVALGPDHPGSAFVAFQDRLLELHDRGVILALCTKNNEADVLNMLDEHPFQVLRREHFAATRINWQNKATNLVELALELNIELDAMIFIDDSSFECDLVRQHLPEVRVVQAPADPLQLPGLVDRLHTLDMLDWGKEDQERGKMHRAQAARKRTRAGFDSLDDYLRSLEMRLDLSLTGAAQIPRTSQLTRKTNQFNLTTRRYGEADIAAFLARADCVVAHVHLADRFGEYGLTGVVILCQEDDTLRIDTFLLSCRIIGRRVEDAVIAWVLRFAGRLRVAAVIGEYVPSGRNQATADLYARLGFEASDVEGRWHWPVGRPPPPYPDCFRLTLPDAASDD